MNYRKTELLPTEDVGDAGTKIIDLSVVDPISRIEVKYGALNGDTGSDDHPAANLPKIEVVDGSDVLYSLTGKCGQAVAFYDGVLGLHNTCTNYIGAYQECVVPINFGRFLRDPLLALDPKKFVNPQLKVTFDVDAANTSAGTGYLTVYVYLFDEKVISPVGFLLNKEHYSYAPSANGYETLELPRDYLMRRFAIQMQVAGTGIGGLFSECRLDENFLKKIPFDESVGDMYMRHRLDYPVVMEQYEISAVATAANQHVTPALWSTVIAIPRSGTEVLKVVESGGGRLAVNTAAATEYFYTEVRGVFPHVVIDYPLGDQMDIADWLNAPALESLRLRIKAASSAANTQTFRVLTQQLRRY